MRSHTLRRAFLAGSILSLMACSDDNEHLYRAGEPGGPTGPGYWNDYYCQWAGGMSVQRATMPSYPQAAQGTNVSVASPALQDTGADQLLAAAKQAALAQLEYQAAARKYQVEQRTSCDLRCEKRDERNDFAYGAPTAAEDSTGSGGSSASASQASGTNNQVAGVDEADFLKNDNKYMYVAANGALRVIDAFPGNQAHQLSKPEIDGAPKKLLTTDTLGVVFSSAGSTGGTMLQECTYGYSCVPTGDGLPTNITVLDLSDKSNPKALRTIKASGSLLTARRIGNMIHAVIVDAPLQQRLLSLAKMQLTPAPCVESDAEYAQEMARIDATKAQAVATIESVVDVNPSLTDSAFPDTPLQSRVYTSPRSGQASVITVLSFSAGGEAPISLAAIVGNPGHVYASASNLYMAVPEFQSGCTYQTSNGAIGNCGWYAGYESSTSLSNIHTFELGTLESPTRYVGSALVQGTVLNQFSMDEYDGHLRVATTTGHTPSPGVASTLTVLRRDAEGLVEVGKVGQIAPTEDIRSVRFDGDRGFIVTFKKTDPLFAFDLSEPTNPRLAGELKIPGFSTYMHLMDRTHLLTIGYDADDQGSFAYFNGVQLQIFDVSDLNNPTLLHKESIGTRGSSSEALTNHLAFTYFAPKQLLALPMTICEGGGNGSFGTNMTFNGLLVYRVTLEGGFEKLGGIPLGQTAEGGYNHALCSSWWTDANSSVKRSVIMDDFVYSVSQGKIQASVLSDLEHPVAEVLLK